MLYGISRFFQIVSKLLPNLTWVVGSRVICLAQIGFAAFDKDVQFTGESPYNETEQLSRLTSAT